MNVFDYKNCTVVALKARYKGFVSRVWAGCSIAENTACADFIMSRQYLIEDFNKSDMMPANVQMRDFDYKNCTENDIESQLKKIILWDFYAFIYAKNTKCVKYLLEKQSWLKDILQPSLPADIQFYDFEKQEHKPNVLSDDLLKVLENYCKMEVEEPIIYAYGIKDDASYMSSSMQNKNAVKWEYETYTFLDLVKQEHSTQNYAKFCRDKNESTEKSEGDKKTLTPDDRKKLSTMGNSWFVSFMYHFLHKKHDNWVKTIQSFRTGTFKKTKELGLHKQYIETILNANEASLNTNQIGLTGAEIKKMAQEIKDNWTKIETDKEYNDTNYDRYSKIKRS